MPYIAATDIQGFLGLGLLTTGSFGCHEHPDSARFQGEMRGGGADDLAIDFQGERCVGLDRDACAAREVDGAVAEVGAAIDARQQFADQQAAVNRAEDDDVEQPVVEARFGGDRHPAAEVAPVGDRDHAG